MLWQGEVRVSWKGVYGDAESVNTRRVVNLNSNDWEQWHAAGGINFMNQD